MAKIYGLFGSMTGKLADTVMSVRNGEQIARKYQPLVFNPSTPAQVAQRAKLKLLSQLSAVMAPVIAIPRQGNVSSRNLFTKKNFGATSFTNNMADVTLTDIQLTNSVVSFPPIVVTRSANEVGVFIPNASALGNLDVSRVIYAGFVKQTDNTLRYFGSVVVDSAGSSGDWGGILPNVTGNIVVYAYGVRDNTESARVIFGNLATPTAEEVAKIITSRVLTERDITMTETAAVTSQATSKDAENESSEKKKK